MVFDKRDGVNLLSLFRKVEIYLNQLKEKRIENGVLQEELAKKAGISLSYLKKIENGACKVSDSTMQKVESALDELIVLKSDVYIELMIDYLRIHFKTKDLKRVSEEFLHIPYDMLRKEPRGLFSFTELYKFGEIMIAHEPSGEENYTLLEMRGAGCRTFECILGTKNITWHDFLTGIQTSSIQADIKRLDIAIDDFNGILDVPSLIKKRENGEFYSRWIQSYSTYKSGKGLKGEYGKDKDNMGETLYLGSSKSELYFCVYQKNYEQAQKEGMTVEEIGDTAPKTRFEIRLKDERSQVAVEHFVSTGDIADVAFGIINNYMMFEQVEADGEKVVCPRWEKFLSGYSHELKIAMRPEPYTVDKTIRWLKTQVFPSLLLAMHELDTVQGTQVIHDMYQNTKMTAKHEKMLEQIRLMKELREKGMSL